MDTVNNLIYYFVFSNKTAFIPLKQLYPECYILRKQYEQVNPLQCLEDYCPANRNCMETLAKRINYLYENVLSDKVELLIAYYKNNNDSLRAGLFYEDMREPTVITCNRSAIDKFRKEGITYQWIPTDEFFMLGSSNDLIKPEDLLKLR